MTTSRLANRSAEAWAVETGAGEGDGASGEGARTAAPARRPQVGVHEIGSAKAELRQAMKPAAPPYVFSEQIGYLMRRAYQRHLAIFQQHACDPQLTAVQLSTLCALRDNGPSSQTGLVRVTGVDQATIRGIIDRLKARGLLKLSPGKDDGRKVIAELTPQGAALIAEMVPHAHAITERTLDRLNPAEQVALVFLLRKLIDSDEAS